MFQITIYITKTAFKLNVSLVVNMIINLGERFKKEFSSFGIAMIPLMIGINVIGGFLAAGTPIWMDTIGTMIAGLIVGPFNAFVVGLLTNVFKYLTYDAFALPYATVNAIIGLVTGFLAISGFIKQEKTPGQIIRVIISGIILAIFATLTSTPFNVTLWGGYTGKPWVDAIFTGLYASGWDVWVASMTAEFISDIVDKTITFFITWLVYLQVPKMFIKTTPEIVE